jgi:transposase
MGRRVKVLVLSSSDEQTLRTLTRQGVHAVRQVKRAQVLLALSTGVSGYVVAAQVGLCVQTVYKIAHRYRQAGLAGALQERPRSGGPVRFDGSVRAHLTALACSEAPAGHSRWTVRLLADRAVELALVPAISHESVRQVLKKMNYSLTAGSSGALEN